MTYPAKAKSAEGNTASIDCSLHSIFTFESLYQGYISARKGKRNKHAVQKFEKELTTNITTILNEIHSQTYVPIPPRKFFISCKATGKKREIAAPSFRDSVVQHTLYNAIYDIFDRGFIFDSYGCRRGKGTHKASDRCQKFLRKHSGDLYYLQMDIRKFYYSIRHDILKESIERKIKDATVVDIIMSYCDDPSGIGLNIGNLMSQLFGLIFLDRFDHFVKRVLKQKHYIRYVDDSVIIGLTREEAYRLKDACKSYLETNLDVTFSKWKISKIKKGINFVGYRTWKSRKFIRKRSLHNFSKSVKTGDVLSIQSILSHAKCSSSYHYLINSMVTNIDLSIVNKLHEGIRHSIRSMIIRSKQRTLYDKREHKQERVDHSNPLFHIPNNTHRFP